MTRMRRVVIVGFAVVIFSLVVGLTARRRAATQMQVRSGDDANHLIVELPDGYRFGANMLGRHLDITPDGKQIVYAGQERGEAPRLYVQPVGDSSVRELPGTDYAADPVISPDGLDVFFNRDKAIKKVPLDGSAPPALVGAIPPMRGTAWLDSDTLVVGMVDGPLRRMRISTGESEPLWQSTTGDTVAFLHPNVLPGNDAILCTISKGSLRAARVGVFSFESGNVRTLLPQNGFAPRYLPSGHIVFATGFRRELMAVRFDPEKLEVIGTPHPVLREQITGQGSGGSTDYAFSSNGTLIYTSPPDERIGEVFAEIQDVDLTQIHVRLNWFAGVARLLP
jgi:hypothetical protein